MRRGIFYSVGLVLGFFVLLLWQYPSSKTQIIACDVGQGDALLITRGDTQVVVDSGPSGERILSCLERYLPFYDRQIELVVVTHADLDHIGGLAEVLKRYHVGELVTGDGVNESGAVARVREVIKERKILVEAVEQGEYIRVGEGGEIGLKVLWPPRVDHRRVLSAYAGAATRAETAQVLGESKVETNERGVVLLLEQDNYRALLMGDVSQAVEEELLESGQVSHVDYLKVGHHGSKYSSGEDFLQKVRPSTAVISVGAKNRYGHPTVEALSRLTTVGASLQRTDQEGDVVVTVP